MISFLKNIIDDYKKKSAFKLKTRAGLYKVFAFRSKNNLDIKGTLLTYSELYSENKMKAGQYLFNAYEEVSNGATVSEALSPYLPKTEITIISASEMQHQLDVGSENASFFAESQLRVKKPVKGIIYYLLGWLFFGVGFILIMSYMSSSTTKVLSLANIPSYAQAFYSLSGFIENWWWAVILFIIAMFSLLAYRLPRGYGKFREFLHKRIFPFTVYRRLVLSSFLISLSSLVNSGGEITKCMKFLKNNSTPYLSYYLEKMFLSSSDGDDETLLFDVDLIDPFTRVNLIDFTKLKEPEAIKELAVYNIEETIEQFDKLRSTIKFVMLIIIAVLIGWAYISMLGPIMEQAYNSLDKIV